MAIPIVMPAQPVWPRVLVLLASVFFLFQASGASGREGDPDACHLLARAQLLAGIVTCLLYYLSERAKLHMAAQPYLRALNPLFLLSYYASALLLWAAPPILIGRSEGLLNRRPLPRAAALPLVYVLGALVYARASLGLPSAAALASGRAALAHAASLSGGLGLALQALLVYAPAHLLATRLQRTWPHLHASNPHDLSLQGLRHFLHDDGVGALAALCALAALQYALFTPEQTVTVLGEVVLDEPVPLSAALYPRGRTSTGSAAAAPRAASSSRGRGSRDGAAPAAAAEEPQGASSAGGGGGARKRSQRAAART